MIETNDDNQVSWGYQDQMTQEMLDALPPIAALFAERDLCEEELEKLKKVDTSLPATAASGKPVVHGARCVIYALQDYWKERLHAVNRLL